MRPALQQVFDQLQVALGLGIEKHEGLTAVDLGGFEVGQKVLLGFGHIGQQGAGRSQTLGMGGGQRRDLRPTKAAAQGSAGRGQAKVGVRPLGHMRLGLPAGVIGFACPQQDFLGRKFCQQAGQLGPVCLGHDKLAGGQRQDGQADPVGGVGTHGRQAAFGVAGLEQRARGDDPDNLAP